MPDINIEVRLDLDRSRLSIYNGSYNFEQRRKHTINMSGTHSGVQRSVQSFQLKLA